MQLIFDLDDTLIQSFPSYELAHRETALALGWPVLSTHALIEYRGCLRETIAHHYPDRDTTDFHDAFVEIAQNHRFFPIDGVVSCIEGLKSDGHQLWILTKRSRLRLSYRLSDGGLNAEDFEGIFCAEDQSYQKPDPRCFDCLPCLSVDKSQIVYIGDRAEDRSAARRRGISFIGVESGPESLHLPEPIFRATHLEFPDSPYLSNISQLRDFLRTGQGIHPAP